MIAYPMIGLISVMLEAIGILLVSKKYLRGYTLVVLLTVMLFFII